MTTKALLCAVYDLWQCIWPSIQRHPTMRPSRLFGRELTSQTTSWTHSPNPRKFYFSWPGPLVLVAPSHYLEEWNESKGIRNTFTVANSEGRKKKKKSFRINPELQTRQCRGSQKTHGDVWRTIVVVCRLKMRKKCLRLCTWVSWSIYVSSCGVVGG